MRIFAAIIVPLSKPALATVGLFYALGYMERLVAGDVVYVRIKSVPLQYLLQSIMSNLEHLTSHMQAGLHI